MGGCCGGMVVEPDHAQDVFLGVAVVVKAMTPFGVGQLSGWMIRAASARA